MGTDDTRKQLKEFGQALSKLTCAWESEVVPSVSAFINRWTENEARLKQAITEASKMISKAISELPDLSEISRSISAISQLGDAQFVTWNFTQKDFVDEILESKNINKTLRLRFEKEHYLSVLQTAEKCKDHPVIKANKKVFEQAISAFRLGYSDLAVVGLTATLDGALSVASDKLITNIPRRTEELFKKIKSKKAVNAKEISAFSLVSTFQKSMAIFGADSDFHKPEPKTLNRHWIAHGRSTRKRTKLDCVKMINMIYGLLLISELDKTER